MSIFNKVFGKGVGEKIALNSAEAFAAIALVAIASDGYLSESEETEMKMRLGRMRLFKSSMDSFERTKDYLVDALKKHGPNELIQCAKASLPPTLASTAFTIAVDLVFSDGTVSSEEQSFIDDLRQILAIPDEMALKIVEVITIKNQG